MNEAKSNDQRNAPAFPCEIVHSDYNRQPVTGLTKRELFAAMAMQALIGVETWRGIAEFKLAEEARTYADALLTALQESTK